MLLNVNNVEDNIQLLAVRYVCKIYGLNSLLILVLAHCIHSSVHNMNLTVGRLKKITSYQQSQCHKENEIDELSFI